MAAPVTTPKSSDRTQRWNFNADVREVLAWVLDYSCSSGLSEVVSALCDGDPKKLLQYDIPEARLVAHLLWTFVSEDMLEGYELCIHLIRHTYIHAPLMHFKHYARILFALKVKVMLHILTDRFELCLASSTLKTLFPKEGEKLPPALEHDATAKKHLNELNYQSSHFRQRALALILDREKREAYARNEMDEEFGTEFTHAIQTLVDEFVQTVERFLPVPVIQQMSSTEQYLSPPDRCSSAVSSLLTVLAASHGHPSSADLTNLVHELDKSITSIAKVREQTASVSHTFPGSMYAHMDSSFKSHRTGTNKRKVESQSSSKISQPEVRGSLIQETASTYPHSSEENSISLDGNDSVLYVSNVEEDSLLNMKRQREEEQEHSRKRRKLDFQPSRSEKSLTNKQVFTSEPSEILATCRDEVKSGSKKELIQISHQTSSQPYVIDYPPQLRDKTQELQMCKKKVTSTNQEIQTESDEERDRHQNIDGTVVGEILPDSFELGEQLYSVKQSRQNEGLYGENSTSTTHDQVKDNVEMSCSVVETKPCHGASVENCSTLDNTRSEDHQEMLQVRTQGNTADGETGCQKIVVDSMATEEPDSANDVKADILNTSHVEEVQLKEAVGQERGRKTTTEVSDWSSFPTGAVINDTLQSGNESEPEETNAEGRNVEVLEETPKETTSTVGLQGDSQLFTPSLQKFSKCKDAPYSGTTVTHYTSKDKGTKSSREETGLCRDADTLRLANVYLGGNTTSSTTTKIPDDTMAMECNPCTDVAGKITNDIPVLWDTVVHWAIQSTPTGVATLADICQYLSKYFPQFGSLEVIAQSVCMSLSVHRCFQVVTSRSETGRVEWMLSAACDHKFISAPPLMTRETESIPEADVIDVTSTSCSPARKIVTLNESEDKSQTIKLEKEGSNELSDPGHVNEREIDISARKDRKESLADGCSDNTVSSSQDGDSPHQVVVSGSAGSTAATLFEPGQEHEENDAMPTSSPYCEDNTPYKNTQRAQNRSSNQEEEASQDVARKAQDKTDQPCTDIENSGTEKGSHSQSSDGSIIPPSPQENNWVRLVNFAPTRRALAVPHTCGKEKECRLMVEEDTAVSDTDDESQSTVLYDHEAHEESDAESYVIPNSHERDDSFHSVSERRSPGCTASPRSVLIWTKNHTLVPTLSQHLRTHPVKPCVVLLQRLTVNDMRPSQPKKS